LLLPVLLILLILLATDAAPPGATGPTIALAGFRAFEAASSADASLPARNATGGAGGGGAATPSIRALRLNGTGIRVDGRLDDAPWAEAPSGSGFRQYDPDRGEAPAEQTVFKVAYDADALYFGIACYTRNGTAIRQNLSRRDSFTDSDLAAVFLDPYHDRTTGYAFIVNPLGVQQDRFIRSDVDGDFDFDWDAVWQAETHRDEDGWYAEMRIPFSSIRYREDAPAWGLLVSRYLLSQGEEDAWVTWDREEAGFVSRFGRLDGLRDIPAPRQLELLPYTAVRATDAAVSGPEELDRRQNLGLDARFGLTSALTLNATFQPDFGQVESDPAVLNLSPHEVQFEEKRPFFIEGRGFFQHPDFNLFYSRRIGTGSENARIRYAGKLTGKTQRGFSIGALAASTDEAPAGQAHNPFQGGARNSRYFVGRIGQEFAGGARRVSLIQTAVQNTGSPEDWGERGSREAYTTGADFDLRFAQRRYVVRGSFVGSIIDPEGIAGEPSARPAARYGTGGRVGAGKAAGTIRYSAFGRWESDRLDLNDLGFLTAPDDATVGANVSYSHNPKEAGRLLRSGYAEVGFDRTWLYAGRTGRDLHTGRAAWSYGPGHPAFLSAYVNVNGQFRNYYRFWGGASGFPDGTQRYETRTTVRLADGRRAAIPGAGPLISEPATFSVWLGGGSDDRRELAVETELNFSNDRAKNLAANGYIGLEWTQNSAIHHELELRYGERRDDTQHLDNFENPGGGIGGISYVFGRIYQRTVDVTLRSSLLFSRNQSLEIYAQPFVTVGDYSRPRELARADTYALRPYAADGFDVRAWDFRFASVNLNAVYRWEYRPGSTLFLVWTQSRAGYDERGLFRDSGRFANALDGSRLFRKEPENVLLAKLTWWIPL